MLHCVENRRMEYLRTTATRADVERCLKNSASYQESSFYALLAGSGLRVAEALAIHVGGTDDQTSWNESTSTISVHSSMYRGKEQNRVKTPAAIRSVDLDPRLNAAIAQFVTENKTQPGAFLFQSRSGRAMHLLTAFTRLHKHNVHGFHAFRRFRITWLRDLGMPEDIIRYWVGHAGKEITDRYSKLAENVELRKQWSVRAGLGFDISIMGHSAPRIPKKPSKPKPVADIVAQPAEPTYVASDEDLDPFFATPVTMHEEV
jgi:integrase